jgi:hypothetical protein
MHGYVRVASDAILLLGPFSPTNTPEQMLAEVYYC